MKMHLISEKIMLGVEVVLSVILIGAVVVHILKTGDLSALSVLAVLLVGCPMEIVMSKGMTELLKQSV